MTESVGVEATFNWYALVSATVPLEQGDLLNKFPIAIPPADIAKLPTEPEGLEVSAPYNVARYDVVVMTQSCDLPKLKKEDEVILCPRFDYWEISDENPKFSPQEGGWKLLINGRFIGAHIMDKCEQANHEFDYQVIDLQRVFSVPLYIIQQVARNQGDRIRLLPPYREHLAQAFARQFMRIGLPIDLPAEPPTSS